MPLVADTWERRRILRGLRRLIDPAGRFVDFGVRILVIERAPPGDPEGFLLGDSWVRRARAQPLEVPGVRSLRPERERGEIIAPIAFGGVWDCLLQHWHDETEDPVTWYCGRGQVAPIMHGHSPSSPGRYVCVGSAGSGKSEVGGIFGIKRVLTVPGKAFGCVAPTGKRLKVCWEKVVERIRPSWIDADQTKKLEELVFVNGRRMQFAAAKEYSSAFGSPLQGYTWDIGVWVDEEQDIVDKSMADAEMRGRNPRGRAYYLHTCTLKRDPIFRERRARYEAHEGTVVQPMPIHDSPFVSEQYLSDLKDRLTDDEYTMLVLAKDAPPERAIYSMFDRRRHLRPWPKVGARDITSQLTQSRAMPNGAEWIIGHDPGTLWDVSLGLKAFEMPEYDLPVWWVMWEVSTRKQVLDRHVDEVTERLRGYSRAPSSIVVADPYAWAPSDSKPNTESYRIWRQRGYVIRPAAFSKANPSRPGKVPKKEGIDMVRMLLQNAAGTTRLYIDCDDRTQEPSARRLVSAFESMEYSEAGEPETEKKDKYDMSHWPATVRYGLWPWERARLARLALRQGK